MNCGNPPEAQKFANVQGEAYHGADFDFGGLKDIEERMIGESLDGKTAGKAYNIRIVFSTLHLIRRQLLWKMELL